MVIWTYMVYIHKVIPYIYSSADLPLYIYYICICYRSFSKYLLIFYRSRTMEFFGRIVGDKAVEIDIAQGCTLHLSHAVSEGPSDCTLMTNAGCSDTEDSIMLCALSSSNTSARQTPLNLYFSSIENRQGLMLWSTGGKIHISGYIMRGEADAPSSSSLLQKRKAETPIATADDAAGSGEAVKMLPWTEFVNGSAVKSTKPVSKSLGVVVTDYVIGGGIVPKPGATVRILYQGCFADGTTLFDSRISLDSPFVFRKGTGQVIRGLDVGIDGMKIGGQREIFVPSESG